MKVMQCNSNGKKSSTAWNLRQFRYRAGTILLIIGLGGFLLQCNGFGDQSTPPAVAPDTPTGLSFTDVEATKLTVRWTAPANPGSNADGSPASIENYTLETSTDAAFSDDIPGSPFSTSLTSYTVDGLTVNTPYYFRVKAKNTADVESGWLTGNQSTTAAVAPDIPTGLSFTEVEAAKLTVGWTAPANPGSNADGSPASIESYTLEVSTDAAFSDGIPGSPFTTSQTTYTIDNLTDNTLYYFRVKARNSISLESGWLIGDQSTTHIALTWAAAIKNGSSSGGQTVEGMKDISSATVSPDGKNVYVTGTIEHSVIVFKRDSGDGMLTFFEVIKDGIDGVEGLEGPVSAAVSPDGKNVYVVSLIDGAMVVFTRDPDDGALTYINHFRNGIDSVNGLTGVRSVIVSPDGENVYAAGITDQAVVVFARNRSDGTLVYLNHLGSGSTEFGGWFGWSASSVAVSPDGKNVYAVGTHHDTVAIFSRDSTFGLLTYVEHYKNGLFGVFGLEGACAITVSPDGGNVYVASQWDNSVATFTRNAGDGTLLYTDRFEDGHNGVDGLKEVNSITVSPDGKNVYVTGAGRDENSVAVFIRNPATRALTYSKSFKDGYIGVNGLEGANSVVVSPDGKNVYAVGDGVVIFNRK